MARQKSTHPVAKSLQKTQDSESSSSSDHSDSESDSPVPSKPVAKNPRTKPTVTKVSPKDSSSQSSGSEDEETSSDSPSDSDSDDVQVPPKASTLKRSRCDDGSPTENARPSKRVTKGPKYIFHKSYNESNGACTILAGKTYFKLPQVVLTGPSKYFREKLARVKKGGRGVSARLVKTIEMQESPEDVGALHWLLTAYPNEIIEQGDPSKADLPRLISILYMANKYQFPEHERWAKSQLQQHFAGSHGKDLKHTNSISSEDYKRLYGLAFSIWPQFKCLIQMKWLSDCDNRTLFLKEVLDFAENINDKFLQAHVYYNELLRLKGGRQDKSLAPLFHKNNFTSTQNMRLYRGFWSLSQFWTSIRTPEIQEGMSEDHRDNCTNHWTSMWEEGAGTTGGDSLGISASQEQDAIFDPLGALDRLAKLPPSPSTSNDARCGCRFQELAESLRDRLYNEMVDHFFGPVIETPGDN